MFFRKKGKLRKKYNENLISLLSDLKETWMNKKHVVQQGIEPSEELLFELRVSEVKYFYAIREAKTRKISLEGRKN